MKIMLGNFQLRGFVCSLFMNFTYSSRFFCWLFTALPPDRLVNRGPPGGLPFIYPKNLYPNFVDPSSLTSLHIFAIVELIFWSSQLLGRHVPNRETHVASSQFSSCEVSFLLGMSSGDLSPTHVWIVVACWIQAIDYIIWLVV